MSVIPLAELKQQLNGISDADDAELQRTLDAAEKHVALTCRGFGAGSNATLRAHLSGAQLGLPATRLSQATAVRDPDGRPVQLRSGATNLLAGIVRVPYRRPGAWEVDVSTADAVPPDLRLAVLIIAAHLWETQRVPGAGPGFGQPAATRPGAAWAIPNRAATLMAPYLLPVIA